VCAAPATLDLVKSLGPDAVVDYTREDFSRAGRVYDTVFDTVGRSGFRATWNPLIEAVSTFARVVLDGYRRFLGGLFNKSGLQSRVLRR
jgi:NADPH:quinone reductase-like Zn-dependent oxidoreductase